MSSSQPALCQALPLPIIIIYFKLFSLAPIFVPSTDFFYIPSTFNSKSLTRSFPQPSILLEISKLDAALSRDNYGLIYQKADLEKLHLRHKVTNLLGSPVAGILRMGFFSVPNCGSLGQVGHPDVEEQN